MAVRRLPLYTRPILTKEIHTMANTAKDNKIDDDVNREPESAFEEHLPLSDQKIKDIQAEAATNTNKNLNQNEGNDPNPQMG